MLEGCGAAVESMLERGRLEFGRGWNDAKRMLKVGRIMDRKFVGCWQDVGSMRGGTWKDVEGLRAQLGALWKNVGGMLEDVGMRLRQF